MPVTWQNVATALGRPASDFSEEAQAQITHWLTGIELLIRSRLGDLAQLDQDALAYVMAEAVAGKVRRDTALTRESSVTVSVDDGNVTRRFEQPPAPVTSDDITDELWDLLSPIATSEAFTINPFKGRRRDPRDGCFR